MSIERTRAWKFLDDRATGVFSGFHWPLPPNDGRPGPWVGDGSPVEPCRKGIHACPIDDLAWWLNVQLWEVELDGPLVVENHQVIAPRGRLVRAVADWSLAAPELATWAAWRARDHAVAVLSAGGQRAAARGIATATDLPSLARALAEQAWPGKDGLAVAVALAADILDDLPNPVAATHTAARAAGHAATWAGGTPAAYHRAFATERLVQSRWMAQRLSLA